MGLPAPPRFRSGGGRRAAGAVGVSLVALAAAAGLTGCAGTGITRARLQSSVARTFANLWVLQQQAQGHAALPAGSLRSQAICTRTSPGTPDVGPGNDWVCNLAWLAAGPSTAVTAVYDLSVKPDGCYTADGDGTPSLDEQPTIIDRRGRSVPNPLWQFDGCFDPG